MYSTSIHSCSTPSSSLSSITEDTSLELDKSSHVLPVPESVITDRKTIEEMTGIVKSHLSPLLGVAEKTGCIISFRPVDRLATSLIEAGYPTKDFDVKGKSASWGPMAAFIPRKQKWSKLEFEPKEKQTRYQEQVDAYLREHKEASTTLVLSKARLEWLKSEGIIEYQTRGNGGYTLFAKAPSGIMYHFDAIPDESGYRIFDQTGEPVKVLCHPKTLQPLTADYDLFDVAPPLSQYDETDNIPLKDITYQKYFSRRSSEGSINIESETEFYKAEIPNKGNCSRRVISMIDQINKALERTEGTEVVHHGADTYNPFSDNSSNYPITVFLPYSIASLPQLVMLNDEKALSYFIQTIRNEAFYTRVNPNWEKKIQVTRRHSFENVLAALNAKKLGTQLRLQLSHCDTM